MSKHDPSPQHPTQTSGRRAVADLEAEAIGVRVVRDGDRYRVFKDEVLVGSLWRNLLGWWGYTTTDGHDGFIHLRQDAARDALVKRHLKRIGSRRRAG